VTYEELVLAISENQYDWDRYLIMSDFLLEEGKNDLAVAYRWMGERHKCPDFVPMSKKKWKWLIGNSSLSPYLPDAIVTGNKRLCGASSRIRYHESFHKSVQYLAWKLRILRQLVTVTGDIQ
jgi:hypothetical protein